MNKKERAEKVSRVTSSIGHDMQTYTDLIYTAIEQHIEDHWSDDEINEFLGDDE